jgi:peptidase E
VSLLGAWRAHGLDEVLRGLARGRVLCGLSAGSLCWFAEAVTGVPRPPERVEGLGLLPSPTACTTTASRAGARSTRDRGRRA